MRRLVALALVAAVWLLCAAPAQAQLVVSLTFDDGVADQMNAAPILDAHGMRATFYLNSARLGHTHYLTLDQARALQASGHEIGGHTASHADLRAIDAQARQRQICGDRDTLMADGFSVRSFAFPFGGQDPVVQEQVAACGYSSARLASGIAGPGTCQGCPVADTIPPGSRWAIRSVSSVHVTTQLHDVIGQVQAAQATGGWLPLVFHHICDGCNEYGISVAWFSELLDFLAAQPDIVVRTVGDAMGGPAGPAVPAQPLTATGPHQLLQNGALELLDPDGVPRCFERGGTGTAVATWRQVAGPRGRRVAQQVRIRSLRRASDAKLISARDAGLCAPRARAGRRYVVRARYRTRDEAHLIAYVRDRGGAWRYFRQSPALRPGPRWRTGRWTTPRLPRGTTALSVGISLREAGTLTVGHFALSAR